MNTTLQEYVDSRGRGLRVDRTAHAIRGVKILGLASRNGRTYRPDALAAAVPLYESAKVNVNHPKGSPLAPRDYQERIGVLRGVRVVPGEGLFGDLHFNPKHALAEQLLWDAEHAPENVGLSHNVEARLSRQGDGWTVEAITAVRSVDLVADPATTRGLYEAAGAAVADTNADLPAAEPPPRGVPITSAHAGATRRGGAGTAATANFDFDIGADNENDIEIGVGFGARNGASAGNGARAGVTAGSRSARDEHPLTRQAWLESLSLDELRRARPDLVEYLVATLVDPLLDAERSHVAHLTDQLDRAGAVEAAVEREAQIRSLLEEYGLPDPARGDELARRIVSEAFLLALRAAPDLQTRRALVLERARLVHHLGGPSGRGRRPQSREQSRGEWGLDAAEPSPHDAESFARSIRG